MKNKNSEFIKNNINILCNSFHKAIINMKKMKII